MKKVTPEAFWKAIGPQNVHPSTVGKYPYTSIFKTPAGIERGRIVSTLETPAVVKNEYYLAED